MKKENDDSELKENQAKIDTINLDSFFNNGGVIYIPLNPNFNGGANLYEDSHDGGGNLNAGTDSPYKDFVSNKWWAFFEKENDDQGYCFKKQHQNDIFKFKERQINLGEIQNIILSKIDKWKNQNPTIDIPNIQVASTYQDSLMYNNNKKNSLILLKSDTLFDCVELERTLGHELGHLIYEKSKNPSYKFSHSNYEFFRILKIFALASVLFGISSVSSLFLIPAIFLTVFFITKSSYYLINWLSFKKRMDKYNEELFCDFVGYKLKDDILVEDDFLLGSDLLMHSHPTANQRVDNIRRNKHNKEWVPIHQLNAKDQYQFMSITGVIVFLQKEMKKRKW